MILKKSLLSKFAIFLAVFLAVSFIFAGAVNAQDTMGDLSEEGNPSEDGSSESDVEPGETESATIRYFRGSVIAVQTITQKQDSNMAAHEVIQYLEVKITEGAYRNRVYSVTNNANTQDPSNMVFSLNDRVMLAAEMTEDESDIANIYIHDYFRLDILVIYFAATLLIVILIGRQQGIRVAGMAVVIGLCYYYLFVPLTLKGINPIILVSPFCLVLVAFNLWADLGFGRDYIASFIGTAASVTCAALLGMVAENTGHLVGLGETEITMMLYMPEHYAMDFNGLTFSLTMLLTAGIAMNISGAICDYMISANSSNKYISMMNLFVYGIQKGRSTMAKSSISLIFASIISFVPTWIVYAGYETPLFALLNMNVVATQLFRLFSALIGATVSVPITAYIFAKLLRGKSLYS